jgi:NADPH:quinone reductase-like Zn-dependent oxidoreductase
MMFLRFKELNMDIHKTTIEIKRKILKKTMLAIRIHSYGGPEVLIYEEAPRPKPAAGEILVRVHAAGVNPVDWKVRQGYLRDMLDYSLPLIPGWDFSGIVESVGLGAAKFKKGDEVYGRADLSRDGAYAEYVVVRESDAAFKPRSIDHIAAAAIPLAALTAWQSLFIAAKLAAGQKILIHAAAGGVGHFAVQLAKWKDAYVIGTASMRNQDFIKQLGVDEPIDYQATRFDEVVRNRDVVFDTMGGETQRRSWKTLKKGGILVSIVEPPSQQEAQEYGVRQSFVFVQNNADHLAAITKLVDSGQLRPFVETVLPLSEARHVQELSQAGHTRGKIVLRIA